MAETIAIFYRLMFKHKEMIQSLDDIDKILNNRDVGVELVKEVFFSLLIFFLKKLIEIQKKQKMK